MTTQDAKKNEGKNLSFFSTTQLVAPSPEFVKQANINANEYKKLYEQSIKNPNDFWAKQAERLSWYKKWNTVSESNFEQARVRWFVDGKLNACHNCIDRHLDGPLKNKIAIIWEGEQVGESSTYTYQQLHYEVCRFAAVLKKRGVQKGDRVLIYLPMIPELAFSVLACARIGAIHSVVFGGFSPNSLVDRIKDCQPVIIITANAGYRGGRIIDIKKNVDVALDKMQANNKQESSSVRDVLVVKRVLQSSYGQWYSERDLDWEDLSRSVDLDLEVKPEVMDAEDPLFILYTSGSTGKPKGVLHSTGGYLLGASLSHYYVFDHKPEDTYWCTADIGWVTGHSYILYGPLSNGATTLMYEGVPTFPDAGRFWDIVDKYQVNVFYTAPTAIRALMKEGVSYPQKRSLKSLRLLGTVGEPINPEAWLWYHKYIGQEHCPIVDTWWQTETGSILITSLPGAIDAKPGSATLPFFGVRPALLDDEGKSLSGNNVSGNLCIETPWPSLMRTVYGDATRFYDIYFSQFKGYYFTGDGATRDNDGYYWVTGRVDDVLNVSGHRIGSAEVESALVQNQSVAEAAVVAYPHDIKGEGIYAYVIVKNGVTTNDSLKQELVKTVAESIGKIARPDIIHWVPGLPKTRSGKIMRRILRKIAEGEKEDLGDTSTLADPSIIDNLIKERK